MATLTRRERSLIGLGAIAALAIGGYLYVVEPLLDRARGSAELATAREATLERRRALIAQRERLGRDLEAIGASLENASAKLLQGPTAPLAASELQKLVKEAAAGANAEVRSERVLPPAELSGLQEIPIELTVAGSIRDTVTLLHQLERTNRLLALKDLNVRVVAPGQPRELLVTLKVAGYLNASTRLDEKPAPPRE